MEKINVPKTRFRQFYHFDEVSSTMLEAEEFIKKGIKNGIVVADSQTEGYGRNSKHWDSPNNGNIYLSFFDEITEDVSHIPQRTAIAALNAVRHFVKDKAVIKWPNDILINMEKTSGIIAKSIEHENKRFYICGIGINTIKPDAEQFEHVWKPTSISDHSKTVTPEALLRQTIIEIENAFSTPDSEIIEKYIHEISWMVERKIRYTQDRKEYFAGVVECFSNDGSAITVANDFEIKQFSTLSITEIE
jgi:biotin-[acetyl-CoA-carboxylase] ligase BirA-like protein